MKCNENVVALFFLQADNFTHVLGCDIFFLANVETAFPKDGFAGEVSSEEGFQASSGAHGLPDGMDAAAAVGAGHQRRIDAWHGSRRMGLATERPGPFGRECQ